MYVHYIQGFHLVIKRVYIRAAALYEYVTSIWHIRPQKAHFTFFFYIDFLLYKYIVINTRTCDHPHT